MDCWCWCGAGRGKRRPYGTTGEMGNPEIGGSYGFARACEGDVVSGPALEGRGGRCRGGGGRLR